MKSRTRSALGLAGLLAISLAAGRAPAAENVDAWVRALGDPKAFLDARAALTRSGEAAIDPLIAALDDPAIAPAAAFVLVDLPRHPERVVPALMAALGSPDADTRRAAATALGSYGADAASALGALELVSADADPWLRLSAAAAMAAIAPGSDATRAVLALQLEDPDRVVRSVSRFTLARIDPDADPTPAFLADLRDSDPDTRKRAAIALAALRRGSPAIVAALVASLGDESPAVWAQTVSTLSALEEPPEIEPDPDTAPTGRRAAAAIADRARDRLSEESSPSRVRVGALLVLAKRGALPADEALARLDAELAGDAFPTDWLPWLAKLTPGQEELRRRVLVESLERGTSEQLAWEAMVELGAAGARAAEAVPVLTRLLDDPELRPRAILTLGAIGPTASEALPRLEAIAVGEIPAIAKLARDAIEQITPGLAEGQP